MNRTLQLPIQTRQANFTPATLNAEDRTVDVVWTTGAAVKRYDPWLDDVFLEELVVAGADLSRLNAGANVLDSHDGSSLSRVIGVVERAWLDKEKQQGYATLRFSNRTEIDPIWQDVQTGILRNISVGYSIDQAERIKAEPKGSAPDTLRVLRFTPMELSVLAVPADAGAQVRGNSSTFPCTLHEVSKMTDETQEVAETSTPPVDLTLVPALKRSREQAEALGAKKALVTERQRITELDDLFQLNLIPRTEVFFNIRTLAINQGWQVEATRKYLLEVLSSEVEPVFDHTEIVADGDMGMQHAPPVMPPSTVRTLPPAPIPPAGSWNRRGLGRGVEVTRDATETAVQSIEQALLVRCGIETDKTIQQEARERGFAGLTYIEMGRRLFEVSGQQSRVAGLDKHGVAKVMLTRAGPMTASDFTGILANVATKIAKKGYAETPTTYQEWCNIGFLPDFKAATIPGLGAFSDLDQIPTGGGPYFYGTFGDNYETATLATYGKLFGISRHALVNDDLNLFSRTGLAMGAAAKRKVNALAYTVLTSPSLVGQTMTEDGNPLFHSTHGNLVANGSGGAPSSTTLNAADAAMAIQTSPKQTTDSSTVYLNVAPAHLIVPPALKATALVLVESMYDPAGTTASISKRDAPNIWRGRLKVTSDPLVIPAEGWFLAAQQGNPVIDTVTVFFLEGSGGEPYTEEQTQFDSDGISYKVRIDAVARALDYRGLYFNDGN